MNRRNFFKALAVAPVAAVGGVVIASEIAARDKAAQAWADGLAHGRALSILWEEERQRAAEELYHKFWVHQQHMMMKAPHVSSGQDIASAVQREMLRVLEDMA